MSTQKTAEEIEALLHHDPDCLSWSHQECDCDYCQITSALTQLGTRALVAEQEAERLRKVLELIQCIPAMPFPDRAAHSERAFGDAVWRAWSRIQQITRAALAPQPTEAQEETAEDIKRSKIMAQINKVREKLLPHPDTERLDWLERSGGIGAVVWKGLSDLGWLIMGQRTTYATLREAIDAARKEAGEKP